MIPEGKTVRPGAPVWDCHVHCYPDEVIASPREWARRQGEPHWGHLVSSGPQGWASPDQLLRAMDRDGVERVLLQAWYWENPDTARRQNDWHAAWVARHPGRFMACAASHPRMRDPLQALGQAAEWGACAVGECLPQVQDPEGWGHPAWEAVIGWTSARQWPLAIHLTEPVGHAYPGRVETSLMEVVGLFERHPDQKWLCAHWGGGLPFHSLNRRVARSLRNVWFDCAAGPLLYDQRVWRTVHDLVGAERIVFGSDFPLLLYPRAEREPGWGRLLREFAAAGLPPAATAAILSGNLRDLLGPG